MLSRREQQLLGEIARALAVQDPELAERLAPSSWHRERARAAVVAVGLLLGVVAPAVVLLAASGVVMKLVGLGLAVVGWVLGMLARLDR